MSRETKNAPVDAKCYFKIHWGKHQTTLIFFSLHEITWINTHPLYEYLFIKKVTVISQNSNCQRKCQPWYFVCVYIHQRLFWNICFETYVNIIIVSLDREIQCIFIIFTASIIVKLNNFNYSMYVWFFVVSCINCLWCMFSEFGLKAYNYCVFDIICFFGFSITIRQLTIL